MNIVSLFTEIWTNADKLAEQETVQFEKLPYKRRVVSERLSKSVGGRVSYRVINRSEYKDNRRKEHIIEMLEMFLHGEGDDKE